MPGSRPVGVTAARRVENPAEEDGDEDEGDQSAGERPEHGAKHIGPERCRVRPGARNLRSGVQRDLLVGRRERPSDLHAAFLTKHEAHLLRRAEPLGMVGAIRRAGAAVRYGAK